MRRRAVYVLCAVVLPVLGLGSNSPKEYDDKTEYGGIEGQWRLTDEEIAGHKVKPKSQCVMSYYSGTYTCDDCAGHTVQGSYRICSTQKPLHLDLTPPKDQTGKFIYQIDGDILRVACSSFDDMHPKGFNDDGIQIWIFKRVK